MFYENLIVYFMIVAQSFVILKEMYGKNANSNLQKVDFLF